MEIAQAEFQGFPQSQVETVPESFAKRFLRLSEEKGPLVPQAVLPDVLGVCKQRVSQFLSEGRFSTYEVGERVFFSLRELESFKEIDRPWGKRGPGKKKV